MHKVVVWKRKCIMVGVKQPGYGCSVLSDTLSVRVGLFQALTDIFQLLYDIFVHHHSGTVESKRR